MRLKKMLFVMLIAVMGVLGITSVNAATISENGKYSLVLTVYEENESIDGEYAKLIRFDVDAGETTVKLSELTKGIIPFNGKNEFSHWVDNNKTEANEDLTLADFTSNGSFYKSNGEEVNYSNGLRLEAKFEGKALEEGDNYYVTLDAFAGMINGQGKLLLVSKSSEFKTIDLTKYTPVRKGYTFIGWDLNGKFVTSIDLSYFTKTAVINLTATYTKNTFVGDDRVLVLDANGGTISGELSKKYDYTGGGDSGTSMSLLPYIPERKGYTFNGWNSKKDGSGKNYTYIYWRRWDKDDKGDVEKDTLIKNSFGAEYYQNVTLYATWTKNVDTGETVKEIKSDGDIKASIVFEEEIDNDYVLDIKKIEVKKELADKNVKYLIDINILKNNQAVQVNGIKMKIRIALPEDLKGYNNYKVVYILNDEIKETIPATIEDGYIVFETSHLSQYGIVATSNEIVENPKTNDNIVFYLAISILSIMGFVGASVIVYKKRQEN